MKMTIATKIILAAVRANSKTEKSRNRTDSNNTNSLKKNVEYKTTFKVKTFRSTV